MFERFTSDARAVVVQAQSETRELGARSIGSEHLLHVMVRVGGQVAEALSAAGLDPAALDRAVRRETGDPLDPTPLAAIGIDLDAVRKHADAVFGPGALDRPGPGSRGRRRGHIPFTKEAKKVLEVALREAIALRNRGIDSGHLVLAVVRMTESAAYRLLITCGADPGAVRTEVLARRSDAADGAAPA